MGQDSLLNLCLQSNKPTGKLGNPAAGQSILKHHFGKRVSALSLLL